MKFYKNGYFITAVVVVVVLIIIKLNLPAGISDLVPTSLISPTASSTQTKTTSPTIGSKIASKTSTKTAVVPTKTPTGYPELTFIDTRTAFNLKDYDNIKITVEKVVLGRGDSVTSTGCQGVPNPNFTAYLYPGSGICISNSRVDGAPRAIVALHLLVENNGGGSVGGTDIFKLHYLRADSAGKPQHRFAYPLSSLASYYIQSYSSREIILSYLVPEDTNSYDLLINFHEPQAGEPPLNNIYDNSSGGLFLNFSKQTISVVK